MHFASAWAGIFLGLAILPSCSVSDISESSPLPASPEEEEDVIDATLVFEGPSAIELSPGETRPITVVATPEGPFELYFALIDAPGDASLDASHVWTDSAGRATVSIHAPGTPASFTLRAWIKNGPSTELAVSVSKQGVGTVEVVPDYDGNRTITEWVGAVIVGTTCDALADKLPGEPKGSLVATSPAQQNPLIQSVPVGPKLAVHVRAGHFAWGCIDAHDIAAGSTTKVKVHVVDVPPALDRTDLALALGFAPEPTAYGKILDSARDAFLGAMFPSNKTATESLLDGMVAFAADPSALALARYEGGWDALTDAHFAQLSAPLPERLAAWIDLGLASAAPEITGDLVAIDGAPGKAFFHVARINGLDAASLGVPPVHLMSWTSAPDDSVFLSGDLYWLPTRLIGAACRSGADQDLGPLASITDSLGKAASCSDLAATLVGTEACDAACLTELCRTALWARWEAASDVSAYEGVVGTIQIGASGVVKVDDAATPIAMSGTWLGTVTDGSLTADASGTIGGILSEDPIPEEPPAEDPP